MKNIILTLAFLLILAINSYSQQAFKTFLPKEGLATATNQAKTDGLKSPELMSIATTSMKFEQMPPLLQPTIEMNSGKASIWIYQFKDKEIDTLRKMIIVVKASVLGFDQFMPVSAPLEIGGELPEVIKTLEGKNWLQTDSIYASIRRNESYKAFAKNNPNHFPLVSFLGLNDETIGLEPDTPYWMTMIARDTTEASLDQPLTCITNAINNETVCMDFTSVTENNLSFKIFPNPTSDQFYIEFDKQLVNPLSISIINLTGVEVMNIKLNEVNGTVPLNINNLPSGEYLIWMYNQEINTIGKIIKQ